MILASFHAVGSLPCSRDAVNSIWSGIAKTSAHSFSIRGCILSGPGDLLLFRFCSNFCTSDGVNVISVNSESLALAGKSGK